MRPSVITLLCWYTSLLFLPFSTMADDALKYPFGAGQWVDLPALEIQCLQSGVRQFTLVNPLKEPVRVVIEVGNFPDTIQLFRKEEGRFRRADETGELMAGSTAPTP